MPTTTPYADLIVDFQAVLAKHVIASEKLGVAKYRKARDGGIAIENAREAERVAGVVVLQKFNAVLTDLQHEREAVRGSVRSRRKRCIHCDKLEQASVAHRDRDGKWVCDGCWDERMA